MQRPRRTKQSWKRTNVGNLHFLRAKLRSTWTCRTRMRPDTQIKEKTTAEGPEISPSTSAQTIFNYGAGTMQRRKEECFSAISVGTTEYSQAKEWRWTPTRLTAHAKAVWPWVRQWFLRHDTESTSSSNHKTTNWTTSKRTPLYYSDAFKRAKRQRTARQRPTAHHRSGTRTTQQKGGK